MSSGVSPHITQVKPLGSSTPTGAPDDETVIHGRDLGPKGLRVLHKKRPLIRNRQTRGLLKQLNLDRALTAEGGLTTVSYAKTAC
jgi:hypothetical protein